MIRKMGEDAVAGAVDLHIRCFKDSFLTSLNRDVLASMYENYVQSDLGCAYVCVEEGEIVGLVAGAINPSVYYNEMLKKRGARFIWLTAKRIVKEPRILVSIARKNFGGFFRPDRSEKAYRRANLDVIAVKEEYRGSGIAAELAEAFLEDVKEQGVSEVLLGVKASNVRSRHFYEKIGLKHLRTIKQSGEDDVHIYGTILEPDCKVESEE